MKFLSFLLPLFVLAFQCNSQNVLPIEDTSYSESYRQIIETFNQYVEDYPEAKKRMTKHFERWKNTIGTRMQLKGYHPSIAWNEGLKHDPNARNKTEGFQGDWQFMGPSDFPFDISGTKNEGVGRVNYIRIDPDNDQIMWAGTPAGGVWKTTDGGFSWESISANLPILGSSDIAINPKNKNEMYLATGDVDGGLGLAGSYGVGILKTTDGGVTWIESGYKLSNVSSTTVSKLYIHPQNTDTVIACTSNGIYRTIDAGATWKRVRPGKFRDLIAHPTDPDVIYAAQKGGRIQKSINAGQSWVISSTGIETGGGRMVMAVTPAAPDNVYLLYANTNQSFKAFYVSKDKGDNWSLISSPSTSNILGYASDGSDGSGQADWDLALAVSPIDENIIISGGINLWKSVNGGVDWNITSHWLGETVSYLHADHHFLTFAPGSKDEIFTACDGGVFKSENGGDTWLEKSAGLEIMQMYKIGGSYLDPGVVFSGGQDVGSNRLENTNWDHVATGDGGECIVDYQNPQTVYVESQFGYITRSDNGGDWFVGAWPEDSVPGQFVTPFIIHPTDPNVLYTGRIDVYRTNNKGDNWTKLSNGFTQGWHIEDLEISYSSPNTMYAGTRTGIYRSSDGGINWTDIKNNLPISTWLRLSDISIHPSNPNLIYCCLLGYNQLSKVYKSNDGGLNWENITKTGLPNLPINTIVVDPMNSDALYVGADAGIYSTNDNAQNWTPFMKNFPQVWVNELEIHQPSRKLRAATYGRGLWESNLDGDPASFNSLKTNHGNFIVYPIPSSGILNMKFESNNKSEGLVQVVNGLGDIVKSISIIPGIKSALTISDLSPGIYQMNLKQGNLFKSRKIVLIK